MLDGTRRSVLAIVGSLGAAGLAGCLGGDGDGESTQTPSEPTETAESPLVIESPAFEDGAPVPVQFSCEGENVSPPLSVAGVPDDATSLALVVDDPDAPGRTFTHWLLWGVPASTTAIPQAIPPGEAVSALDGASQGTNDADVVGYIGPCPPPDDGPHTYRFRLLALAEVPDLDAGADRPAFDAAVEEVLLGEAVLTGTFDR